MFLFLLHCRNVPQNRTHVYNVFDILELKITDGDTDQSRMFERM